MRAGCYIADCCRVALYFVGLHSPPPVFPFTQQQGMGPWAQGPGPMGPESWALGPRSTGSWIHGRLGPGPQALGPEPSWKCGKPRILEDAPLLVRTPGGTVGDTFWDEFCAIFFIAVRPILVSLKCPDSSTRRGPYWWNCWGPGCVQPVVLTNRYRHHSVGPTTKPSP